MEDALRSYCAGLDIHQKVIVACVVCSAEGKKRSEKFFGRFPRETQSNTGIFLSDKKEYRTQKSGCSDRTFDGMNHLSDVFRCVPLSRTWRKLSTK